MGGKFYTSEEVEKGIDGIQSISQVTLKNLRTKRKLQYTKIGTKVYYRKEWIEDYINSNIREAITKQEQINENNRA